MLFSAIPDIMMVPEAMQMVHDQLGYPTYFVPFIGVAKVLGAIAILVPGFPRIKEWAYAGLVLPAGCYLFCDRHWGRRLVVYDPAFSRTCCILLCTIRERNCWNSVLCLNIQTAGC